MQRRLRSAIASDALLIYWTVGAHRPAFPALYLMAEHTGCALSSDMLANSRTTLTNAAVRFIVWNMPFHAEHHAFPSPPFHALPRRIACCGGPQGRRARLCRCATLDRGWISSPALIK
jgi:fatty acid desaturase